MNQATILQIDNLIGNMQNFVHLNSSKEFFNLKAALLGVGKTYLTAQAEELSEAGGVTEKLEAPS